MNAVILAAGPSSRLGRPKQNLEYRGNTLLQLAITNARNVAEKVLVILGANENLIATTLDVTGAEQISNPGWQEGMASSIRVAVEHLEKEYPETDHVLFMVCDQPFITSDFLEELKGTAFNTEKGITATKYGDTVGVPVIFSSAYFSALRKLTGDEGAKHILKSNQHDLVQVPFKQALTDIDTEADYQHLLGSE